MYGDVDFPGVMVSQTMRHPEWVKARERFRRRGKTAMVAVAVALAAGMAGIALAVASQNLLFALGGFLSTFLIGLYAAILAARALLAPSPGPKENAALVGIFGLGGGLALSFLGAVMTLFSTMSFARGRQLRRRGRVLLAPVVTGEAWSSGETSLPVMPDREAVAAQWRENGRTEHASVAAFARLTIDLIALGAPPRLVADAQSDALDEIRHTEWCFSLARGLDGRAESPGPFDGAQKVRRAFRSRTLALCELAVTSLVDGAFHEGLSAAVLASLARACPKEPFHDVLARIAADEGRHAAHGWDAVEWCLREGGERVANALGGALLAMPQGIESDRPDTARLGAWESYGIHGDAREAAEYERVLASVERRVTDLLSPRAAA